MTQAFTHSASLAWQRAQRASVTPVRAWTIPLTTAKQVPVPVQPASDPGRLSQGNRETPLLTCLKYSRNDGECPFGSRCRYLHCCSRCKGSHPVKRCPLAATGPREKHEALTRAHLGLVIVVNGCGDTQSLYISRTLQMFGCHVIMSFIEVSNCRSWGGGASYYSWVIPEGGSVA